MQQVRQASPSQIHSNRDLAPSVLLRKSLHNVNYRKHVAIWQGELDLRPTIRALASLVHLALSLCTSRADPANDHDQRAWFRDLSSFLAIVFISIVIKVLAVSIVFSRPERTARDHFLAERPALIVRS